jgi:hypothetical protein
MWKKALSLEEWCNAFTLSLDLTALLATITKSQAAKKSNEFISHFKAQNRIFRGLDLSQDYKICMCHRAAAMIILRQR